MHQTLLMVRGARTIAVTVLHPAKKEGRGIGMVVMIPGGILAMKKVGKAGIMEKAKVVGGGKGEREGRKGERQGRGSAAA